MLLYLVVPVALVRGILAGALSNAHPGRDAANYCTADGGMLKRASPQLRHGAFQSPWYFLTLLLGGVLYAVLILSVYGYLMRCVHAEQPGAPITVPAGVGSGEEPAT
ncbi:MAG: hypothetical protein WKG07_10480 [Hymenobacter sp.]